MTAQGLYARAQSKPTLITKVLPLSILRATWATRAERSVWPPGANLGHAAAHGAISRSRFPWLFRLEPRVQVPLLALPFKNYIAYLRIVETSGGQTDYLPELVVAFRPDPLPVVTPEGVLSKSGLRFEPGGTHSCCQRGGDACIFRCANSPPQLRSSVF